jgi:hypothetical protein
MSKVFSQEHYEQDDWAKHQIIEWLRTQRLRGVGEP